MTTQEIANRLVEICRSGEWEKAQRELYADDAISKEPYATPEFEKETKGLKAILDKGRKFDSMIDTVHSLSVSDPIVAENSFACILDMDISMKQKGRMQMKELCIYKVKDGKIIEEEFVV
ncbi:MAG: nuclear transport factor 2 family protein [Niastella sp.]|nr:nuclear transport factor 2 family protein [Niastella sp.]